MDERFIDRSYEHSDIDESFVTDFLYVDDCQKFTPYNQNKVLNAIDMNSDMNFRNITKSPNYIMIDSLLSTPFEGREVNLRKYSESEFVETELTTKDHAKKVLEKLELHSSEKMKVDWEMKKSKLESISKKKKSIKKMLLCAFKDSLEEK